MKVLNSEEMRWVEQECAKIGITTDMLMENAGKAVAGETARILGDIDKKHVVLLIGPGNNGGDGLVAARYLHGMGAKVNLFMPGKRAAGDHNLKLVKEKKISCHENLEGLAELLVSADAVIDALFGTGRSRPLVDDFKKLLEQVAEAARKCLGLELIALDIPSGLDADSGGCDSACLRIGHTITLGFPKPGLFNLPGAGRAGIITVVDIGIPEYLANDITTELINDDWARSVLPKRPLEANKGSFGKVMVIAGSTNYIGAACLACSGAMRVGAGLVTLAAAGSLHSIMATKLTEVTHLPLPEAKVGFIAAKAAEVVLPRLTDYNALLVGCGMGREEETMTFNRSLLLQPKYKLPPLVLDADAINTLAETPGWWRQLTDNAVLTPHANEMSRLTGMTIKDIQADRAGTAAGVAVEWGKTVVLKGAYTVIAAADGRRRICPSANPGLASAGTGDVLAGAIAGMLAQGLKPFDAASLAVWLHARAGEMAKEELGDSGMIAGDLLPLLPKVIKKLRAKKNGRKIEHYVISC